MQFFYFKFTDIYALLFNRFTQNGLWNNTLTITKEKNYCLFEFIDKRSSIELELMNIYDPINKEHTHQIKKNNYNYKLIKEDNEYITRKEYNHEYKINLTTEKNFNINTFLSILYKSNV